MIAKAQPTTTPVMPSVVLDEGASRPWHLTLKLSQLLVGWAAIAAMMLLVFLFGLYAGRRQGVELALEEKSTPRLRLPIADLPHAENLPKTFEPPVAKSEDHFDFSDAATLMPAEPVQAPSQKTNQQVADNKTAPVSDNRLGFVGKAADEILAPKPETSQPLAPAPVKGTSLLESVAKVEISPALEPAKKTEPVAHETVKQAPVVVIASQRPKPVTKVTKTEKKPVETAKTAGLYVQVAAPDSAAVAQNIVNKLRTKGITSAVRDAVVGGKQHYRVLVGPFSSRTAAENARNQVMQSHAGSTEPFIKNF